jgi:glycosyltransferase involved in cell wall biosynthesis
LNLCRRTNSYFENIIGCINKGALYEDAVKMGFNAYVFTQSSRMDLRISEEIASYVDNNKIDIVNFHGANPNFLHMFMGGKLSAPSVTTIHSDYRYDFINNKLKYVLFTPLNSLAIRRFRNFICVSKRISDTLETRGVKGCKFVVRNGIDTTFKISRKRDDIRRECKIPDDAFVYTMVARFHPIKNHSALINAARRLIKEHNDIRLMLVGSGDLEDKIRLMVKDLGMEQYVVFTGYKDNPVDYINAGDINILTSFNETFPIVILEGALAGKSAICSDVGDIGEILDEGTGFIVDPYSVDDIYEKMKKSYEHRDILGKMGSNLKDIVVQNYSSEMFYQRYYNAYKKILTGDNDG